MTESEDRPVTPDAPRPPGTPDVDLDVEIPDADREQPDSQDVDEDAGEIEPPG
ncbi:hypothetical protein ABJI51_40860 [Amycolatopsis sp. NEAU-NG30]|jgi:hypothetical protein|uniref:Uncharacterized protein n=1 Tax=Amycolatopsis melonis TaxID=3156488 RepID=A0ABV0LT38_9PSEU